MEQITAVEARQRLGEMLNRVALRHDQIIITRGGKPLARLVPLATPQPAGQLLDLREAAGLGSSVWSATDAASYVSSERDSWE